MKNQNSKKHYKKSKKNQKIKLKYPIGLHVSLGIILLFMFALNFSPTTITGLAIVGHDYTEITLPGGGAVWSNLNADMVDGIDSSALGGGGGSSSGGCFWNYASSCPTDFVSKYQANYKCTSSTFNPPGATCNNVLNPSKLCCYEPCVPTTESIAAGNCEDGIDNDCDGYWDYDTQDWAGNPSTKGDDGCPVLTGSGSMYYQYASKTWTVTDCIADPNNDNFYYVKCGVNPSTGYSPAVSVEQYRTKLDFSSTSPQPCTYQSASGGDMIFKCTVNWPTADTLALYADCKVDSSQAASQTPTSNIELTGLQCSFYNIPMIDKGSGNGYIYGDTTTCDAFCQYKLGTWYSCGVRQGGLTLGPYYSGSGLTYNSGSPVTPPGNMLRAWCYERYH